MHEKPLLSVLIPTRNRARYALPTIAGMAAISPRLEVVVCDSSDIDELSGAVTSMSLAGRVKLVRTPRTYTIVDNFNATLAQASGEYLVFLGDDDVLNPEVMAVLEWARAGDLDTINFSFPATYYWPDFHHRRHGQRNAAKLIVGPYSGRVSTVNSREALREAMINLGGGPMSMPRAYCGIVSRRLVSKIESRFGPLFGGVSPDIYSAVLIAVLTETTICLDYPIVIPGIAGSSGSGRSSNGTHLGQLRDNDHMRPFTNLVWDPLVPEFYSVPTVWAFSMIKALDAAGLQPGTSHASVYAKCLCYYPRYWRYTLMSVVKWSRTAGWWRAGAALASAFFAEARFFATQVIALARKRFKAEGAEVVPNIADSREATQMLAEVLARSGRLTLPVDAER